MSETIPSASSASPAVPPSGDVGAITRRDHRTVVAHYGSAAGELAACLRSVGLALRTDLIARTCHRGAGSALTDLPAGGGTTFEYGGWWCVAADNRTVTLVGRPSSPIFTFADGEAGASDAAQAVVYNVVGPRAPAVLADLGLFGAGACPRDVPPFCETSLGGLPARVISQTLTNFLVIGAARDLNATWRILTDAGRDHRAAVVGIEALERYLITRTGRTTGPPAAV